MRIRWATRRNVTEPTTVVPATSSIRSRAVGSPGPAAGNKQRSISWPRIGYSTSTAHSRWFRRQNNEHRPTHTDADFSVQCSRRQIAKITGKHPRVPGGTIPTMHAQLDKNTATEKRRNAANIEPTDGRVRFLGRRRKLWGQGWRSPVGRIWKCLLMTRKGDDASDGQQYSIAERMELVAERAS